MINILFVYLYGAALVACVLLWTMVTKLDEYDWRYDKGDIWFNFTLHLVLWPLMLLSWFVQGRSSLSEWVRPNLNKAGYQREMTLAYQQIQQCGAYVRFLPSPIGICQESHGEFIFPSKVIERQLIQTLQQAPNLRHNNEGELLAWVQRRDETLTEPVDVPKAWPRFVYLIEDLIQQNSGQVRCRVCHHEMEVGQLRDKSSMVCGHSHKRYDCPNGHALVAYEGIRLTLSTR
ncbi:hypothetical protein K6U49_00305 [Vibrio alginolyticus]|uniref:hypothetical protein n=1 Tax=Vibrio alginolyticus TaxID=663 RepID=UPI001EE9F9DB|nr:hypothetical protein [Vibrio alginolyticus]